MSKNLRFLIGVLSVLMLATACSKKSDGNGANYNPYDPAYYPNGYHQQAYWGALTVTDKSAYRSYMRENGLCSYCRDMDKRVSLTVSIMGTTNNNQNSIPATVGIRALSDNRYFVSYDSMTANQQTWTMFHPVNNNAYLESDNINGSGYLGTNGVTRLQISNDLANNNISAQLIFRGRVIATGILYR